MKSDLTLNPTFFYKSILSLKFYVNVIYFIKYFALMNAGQKKVVIIKAFIVKKKVSKY